MKTFKILNTIAIATPFALLLMEVIFRDGGFAIFALLSTMFTGFVQVILGIILTYKISKVYALSNLFNRSRWVFCALVYK